MRRNHHLDELPFENFGQQGAAQRPIERNDSAESGGRISSERSAIRLGNIVGNRHAARVGMFDNHTGRRVEHLDALQRRIGVGNIVIRKRFALVLYVARNHPGRDPYHLAIESGLLVGVFAIAHAVDFVEGQGQVLRQGICAAQIGRNGGIVLGRVTVGFNRVTFAHVQVDAAGQPGNHFRVVVGLHHHQHIAVVLRR